MVLFEPIINFLDLKKHPLLTKRELAFIGAVSRNVSIGTKPVFTRNVRTGKMIYEGSSSSIQTDPSTVEELEAVRRDVTEEGIESSRGFEECMVHLATGNGNKPKCTNQLVSGVAALARGNFIKRVTANNSNCLEYALTGAILGKTRFRTVSDITLLPYSLLNTSSRKYSLLGHEHYGLFYREAGKEYIMTFGGLAIPVHVISDTSRDENGENVRKTHVAARAWLMENMSGEPNESDIREALAHLLSLFRVVNRLKILGYIPETK